MTALRIELRRSPLLWLLPLLTVVQVYGLVSRRELWIGIWPQTSAAIQFSSLYLGLVLAPISSWVSSRARREGFAESLAGSSRNPYAPDVAQLLSVLIYGLTPIVVTALVAVWMTSGTPGAGSIWPSYLILGALMVVASSSFGFLVGKIAPTSAAPVISAGLFFALAIWVPSETFQSLFSVLSGPPWLQLSGWALAARAAVAVSIAALAVCWVPRGLRTRVRRNRVPARAATAIPAAGLAVALFGVQTAGELQTPRTPPSEPLCTQGAVRVCIWPESAKYLPELQAMADRMAQLDIPSIKLPAEPRLNERGLEESVDGFTDDFGTWGIAQYLAGRLRVDGQDNSCPQLSKDQSDELNRADFELRYWLTIRIFGGAQPTSLGGGPPIDQAAVEKVAQMPGAEQTAWAGQRVAVANTICP